MTDTTAEIERKAERQVDRARTIARSRARAAALHTIHNTSDREDAAEHGFVSFSSVLVGIVLLVLIAGALRFALDALSAAGGAL